MSSIFYRRCDPLPANGRARVGLGSSGGFPVLPRHTQKIRRQHQHRQSKTGHRDRARRTVYQQAGVADEREWYQKCDDAKLHGFPAGHAGFYQAAVCFFGDREMTESQAEKAARFAAMHTGSGILVLPNAWDAISACVLVDAGFEAVATTSGGCAFALGFRDGENTPRDEMAAAVGRIARAVHVPVSADMEAGYGASPEDVAATVRATLAAGAVGVNIEDSDKSGKGALLDFALSVERIRAAVEVVASTGMQAVINARTDAFHAGAGEEAFDEAVRRANAYLEAGALCAFVPFVRDGKTIGRLAREIAGPMNVLAGPGTPSAPELERLGVRRVSVGSNIAKAALAAARRAAEELRDRGVYDFARDTYTQAEIHALLKRAREG